VRRREPGSLPYALKRFKYNSHYWVLKFLSAADPPLRILDVGTANGYLGAILKNSGHSLVGVEQDLAAAEQARPHYDAFHVVDIESFEFPYREEFDFILFADVLEHARDPIRVLRQALPTLKRTGELIISLPNVANIVIRLSLLMGRFDYCERGILDRTHLRFFTLSALRKMIQEASCRILEVAPTPLPVQLVFPISEGRIFDPFHEMHYLLVKSWKTLFAYQFVVRAVPEIAPRGSAGEVMGEADDTSKTSSRR
jgi:2-polyprenyl-3-methyl-5-hydroxy-6-metoxy-1,4-benzoquinol methylase